MNITDHWITTPAGRLAARAWSPDDGPDAAPFVLFHDSLGCIELWREFPAQLARRTGRRVVAYDRLGFGRSDPNPATLDIGFVEAESRTSLPALRAQLGLDRYVAFGHSVGGAMAVFTAQADPTGCVALVTESAQAFAEALTLESIREAKASFQAPGQLQRLEKFHGAKARWVLDAWTETWLSPAFASWRLEDRVSPATLAGPLLAMHGDRDEYGTATHPARLAALTAGPSRVVMLEDCGHVPHRERPGRVLDAIEVFLAEADPRA